MINRGQKKIWVYLFSATGSVLLLAITAFTIVSLFALRQTAYRQTEENLRQFSYAVARNLSAKPELLAPGALQEFCAPRRI